VADQRRLIAEAAEAAYRAELDALAVHGDANVAATGWPARTLDVELEIERSWGVIVPTLADLPVWDRDLVARRTSPGATGPAQFEAANRFEALGARLLEAVAREVNVRALGAALAHTSRQLHTLEERVAPELAARITKVTRALAERDREDQARLRRLRDRAG
jgi:vacuolar-type H+-ATPase subunit D/Vma8